MACTKIKIGETTAIVCTRGPKPRKRRCRWCSQNAPYLCDYAPRDGAALCSAPICGRHATVSGKDEAGEELHRCPRHVGQGVQPSLF